MAQYYFKCILNRQQCNRIGQSGHKMKLFFSTLHELLNDKKISARCKDTKKDAIRTRGVYSLKHCKDISEYIEANKSLQSIKSLIPAHYLSRKFTSPKSMFIIDREVARQIFMMLEPYLKSGKSHIVEANAGIGLLTKNLLKAQIPRLRIYESDSELYAFLYTTINRSNCDAKLFRANLLLMWNMILRDRNDFVNRFDKAFDGIPCYSWDDDAVMKIIVTIPNETFVMHMMYSIIFQSGICVYGRPELFIIMPSSTYFKLVAKPEEGQIIYRSKSVIFQLLFENIILSKYPAKAFIPWLRKTKEYGNYQSGHDSESNYLVKVTARQDLFKRIPMQLLKPLWFFVQSMMRKRSATLISSMENWIPGCGPRLINQGYTIFTICGSLTPEEYFNVFLEFSSWPDFNSSSFLPSMESVLMKMADSGIVEELLVEQMKNVKLKNGSKTDVMNNEEYNC